MSVSTRHEFSRQLDGYACSLFFQDWLDKRATVLNHYPGHYASGCVGVRFSHRVLGRLNLSRVLRDQPQSQGHEKLARLVSLFLAHALNALFLAW